MSRRIPFSVIVWLALAPVCGWSKPPIQASPRAAEHNNQGAALIDQGNLALAEFEIKTAISLSPDYGEAYNNLGIIYKERKQYDQAITYFEKAASLDKTYVAPLSHLGTVYIAQGKLEAAIDILHKALKKDPRFDFAAYNLGMAYLLKAREEGNSNAKQADYAEAEKQLTLATQLNPKLSEAHAVMGDLYAETAQYEKAEIRYKLAIEDNPTNMTLYDQLAAVQRAQGKTSDAAQWKAKADVLRRTETAKKKLAEGLQLITEAETLLSSDKPKEAQVSLARAALALQAAVTNNPDQPEARYALGVVYERQGKSAEARAQWEQLLKQFPGHPGAQYNLGLLAMRAGQVSAAVVYWCDFLKAAGRGFPDQAANVKKQLQEKQLPCPN